MTTILVSAVSIECRLRLRFVRAMAGGRNGEHRDAGNGRTDIRRSFIGCAAARRRVEALG
jgi:hypothetical protein